MDNVDDFLNLLRVKMQNIYGLNLNKRMEYFKNYYIENRERIVDLQKKYNANNRAAIKKRKRNYYQENREKLLEKGRQYRQNKIKCSFLKLNKKMSNVNQSKTKNSTQVLRK